MTTIGVRLERERLAEHEARLRHRSVERIDDEQNAVDHAQNALDLATEVGVAGRVDDVDLGPVPAHRRVLGQDRDSALALERIGIHHALDDDLIIAECAGLPEHLVHERSLAVIDVRDDGDVSDLLLSDIALKFNGSGDPNVGRVPTRRLGCARRTGDARWGDASAPSPLPTIFRGCCYA